MIFWFPHDRLVNTRCHTYNLYCCYIYFFRFLVKLKFSCTSRIVLWGDFKAALLLLVNIDALKYSSQVGLNLNVWIKFNLNRLRFLRINLNVFKFCQPPPGWRWGYFVSRICCSPVAEHCLWVFTGLKVLVVTWGLTIWTNAESMDYFFSSLSQRYRSVHNTGMTII